MVPPLITGSISQPVFSILENPTDIYISAHLRTVLDRVFLFSKQGQSLMSVLAPNGYGKSTLANYIRSTFSTHTHDVLTLSLLKIENSPGWLLPRIANHFGLTPGAGESPRESARKTIKRLDDLVEENRILMIIIDSAEKLFGVDVFNEIRDLLNLQTASGSFISFVLFGDDILDSVLAQTPLQAKLGFSCRLVPLSFQETMEYIIMRLGAAGLGVGIFADSALETIFDLSGGVFSLINLIAENCLSEASLQKRSQVTDDLVKLVSFRIPGVSSRLKSKDTPPRIAESEEPPKEKKSSGLLSLFKK